MRMSDKYYSGREVQRVLGITEPRLRTLVKNKQIKKVPVPGRKTGVYLKADVDAFAAKWEAFLMAKEPPKITFRLATSEDMEAEHDLDARAIGPYGLPADVRRQWLAANGESDYHVYYNGKLVAFLWFVPLRDEIIHPFMQGDIHWHDIQPEKDIVKYETGKPVSVFVEDIASEPDVNETTRTHYMLVLLRGAGNELKKLGRRGVIISKVYARSQTPTGIAAAIHAGMEEYEPMPRTGKLVRFALDVEKSESYLARRYKEGLAEWKQEQEAPRSKKSKKLVLPNI